MHRWIATAGAIVAALSVIVRKLKNNARLHYHHLDFWCAFGILHRGNQPTL